MSATDFEPERYVDEYRERALAMIEEKVKGHEVTVAPAAPEKARGGKVVDIFEALKESLAATRPRREPVRQQRRRKKA